MAKSSTASRVSVKGFKFFGAVPFSRVLDAFNRGPIMMQRNHSKRALKARHIGKELTGAQLVFTLVMWKGKERLIDGYTRVERIAQGLTSAPESVIVLLHAEPASEQRLVELYDQFDSRAALKNTGDRFDEGLRLTKLLESLTSPLVLKGPKSAPKLAVDGTDIRSGVLQAEAGIRFVDGLGLRKTHETLGMLAAYYAIGMYAEQCGDKAAAFIRKMNQAAFTPRASVAADFVIAAVRKKHQEKVSQGSATGGNNVVDIRNQVFTAFIAYMGFESFLPSVQAQVTLGVFHEVMRRASGTK